MKWLTKKQINEAAKKSLRAAWRMSIEHHRQICRATKDEFKKALREEKTSYHAEYCALCRRAELKVGNCPFGCEKGKVSRCFVEWHAASARIDYLSLRVTADFYSKYRHVVLKILVVAYNKKYGTKLRSKV